MNKANQIIGLKEEAFIALHESLVHARPEFKGRDVILCPICLREIARTEVLTYGIEHIIPRVATRKDEPNVSRLGRINQRSGITILCREKRIIVGTGEVSNDGCNGFKGKVYDWAMKNLLDNNTHEKDVLSTREAVGILTMGYLAAFQIFGYDYILRSKLDEIRTQFDFPDAEKTEWLNDVVYEKSGSTFPLVSSSSGQPFIFGGICAANSPLHVIFRRCQAFLPSGHWDSKGVKTLASLKFHD